MTTTIAQGNDLAPYGADRPRRSNLARLASLTRAEATLLLRNRTAVANAFITPIIMVGVFALLRLGDGLGVTVVTMVTAAGINFVVYYTLVTVLVARRDELVLKRLHSGETPSWVIITAAAVPTVAIVIIQVTIAFVAAITVLGLGRPVNAALVVAATLLGLLVWVLLAVITSGFTKTVESAQITTLPLVFIPLLFSGFALPLSLLPDAAEQAAHLLPLTPVVDLFALGLTGRTIDGQTVGFAESWAAAGLPLLTLVGWTVLAALLLPRVFRWEPRR